MNAEHEARLREADEREMPPLAQASVTDAEIDYVKRVVPRDGVRVLDAVSTRELLAEIESRLVGVARVERCSMIGMTIREVKDALRARERAMPRTDAVQARLTAYHAHEALTHLPDVVLDYRPVQ
jgi:hypothetical protein